MKYKTIELNNSTMKLYQLEGYIQSIFIVENNGCFMLLDGCTRADVVTVQRFITEVKGQPLTQLKVVMVTHMHPDHAGAAAKLRQLTGCKVVMGKYERDWYRGFEGALMHWTDMALTRWVAKRKRKPLKNIWYWGKLKPDLRLADGDLIPGFEQWQVIETHGHTDRDISIYHQPSKKMYVADLFVYVRKKVIPPYPVFHPNRYRRSLQKVKKMNCRAFLLAHDGEVMASEADFEQLIAKAPKIPVTYWRSIKSKFNKSFNLN
ncbi:MAG: MBL fold metallo-hydrolase [Kangiellaceae bacterium]|jgi:glyoxylase-like metal-dependent hydrolase (beta-lactamase superfamily II)|nr:MBL fold metallo-hydrolase [Kangiellaceae bacterium]